MRNGAEPDGIQAVAFDVIGTMFSLHSLRPRLMACGLPGHALEAWFAGSLRDLFALGATGRMAPMRDVLGANLRLLLADHHLRQDGARVEAVLDGMDTLEPDPDVRATLELLGAHGLACAALSNGSLQSTERLLERAGLRPLIAEIVCTDQVGLPKPRAEVYRAMAQRLSCKPASVILVASHPWDLHGARMAGFQTAYFSQGRGWPGSFEPPDTTARDLLEVGREIARRGAAPGPAGGGAPRPAIPALG